MGQAEITFASIKYKFNPINWIYGDRGYVRGSWKIITRVVPKLKKQEAAENKFLADAIAKGSVADVKIRFEELGLLSVQELQQYEHAFIDLLLLVKEEFGRLRVAYQQETNPELKKKLAEEIIRFKKTTEGWLANVEAAKSFIMHLSDAEKLTSEVAHILDMFNLQRSAAVARSAENTLVSSIRREKSGKVNQKEIEKYLKRVEDSLNAALQLDSKVFIALQKIMLLERQRTSNALQGIISKLTDLKLPEEHLKVLRFIKTRTENQMDAVFSHLAQDINGLRRIENSVAV